MEVVDVNDFECFIRLTEMVNKKGCFKLGKKNNNGENHVNVNVNVDIWYFIMYRRGKATLGNQEWDSDFSPQNHHG